MMSQLGQCTLNWNMYIKRRDVSLRLRHVFQTLSVMVIVSV